MKIAVSNPENYFAAFYVLSFTVSFVLVIAFCIKHKKPLMAVLLMLTTASLLTVIGSRLVTIPAGEWQQMLKTGSFKVIPGRSAIGGLLFGLAGLIIAKRLLNLDMSVINIYAWITPVAFGIQKIGCFLNGCCYGKPTESVFGVQYPVGTNAHHYQYIHGLIDEKAAYSLSLHPVQLYESLCLFILAYCAWRIRNKWKYKESNLIFSLLGYFVIKFSVEFFRDPSSSPFATGTFAGISKYQWIMLFLIVILSFLLVIYEKRSREFAVQNIESSPSLRFYVIYIFIVSLVIYFFKGLFTRFEIISLDLKFIPAIIMTGYYIFRELAGARIRLVSTSFMVLPLVLVFHSLPQDSTRGTQTISNFYHNLKTYKRIDFGTSIGNFNSELRYNPHEEECGTSYTTEDYKHEFRLAGLGYAKVKKEDNLSTTLGVNIFGGTNKEFNLTTLDEKNYFLFGVGPYIKYDWKWVGFGLGFHAGNLRWVPYNPIDKVTYNSGTKSFPIMPYGSFRVGRQDILDLRYNYGFRFPTSYPVLVNEISLGSGFSLKPDVSFRYGIGVEYWDTHQFVSAEGVVSKKLGLQLRYNFGNTIYLFNSPNYNTPHRGSWLELGANYRFGFEN
jgi:prolipoprotein diacylglyceryltransferase